MTPDLPADHLSALASDDPYALDLLHAQLDEIAGRGGWSYQLTVTGATFAPLVHITADWQLVEYHYADRPLRHVLATGSRDGRDRLRRPPCARRTDPRRGRDRGRFR